MTPPRTRRAPARTLGAPLTRAEMDAQTAAAMHESVLQGRVAGLCKQFGVRHYHTHDSRRSTSGWPDSAMVGVGGFMVRELKREREKPTPAQQAWLDDLIAAGINAGVWRPSDLISGRIQTEIAALAGREQEGRRLTTAMDITRAMLARHRNQGDTP